MFCYVAVCPSDLSLLPSSTLSIKLKILPLLLLHSPSLSSTMAVASRDRLTDLQIPRLWKDRDATSPDRTKVWTEPKLRSDRKVPVVYYLSRNGHLQHPHFMEVPLSSSEGLYLRGCSQSSSSFSFSFFFCFFDFSCFFDFDSHISLSFRMFLFFRCYQSSESSSWKWNGHCVLVVV